MRGQHGELFHVFRVDAPADARQPGSFQAPPREQELGVERCGVLSAHGPAAVAQGNSEGQVVRERRAVGAGDVTPTRPSRRRRQGWTHMQARAGL